MNTPNHEEPIDDTEVEITDLDAPTGTSKFSGRYIREILLSSSRARTWMSVVGIISLVLIVVVVLASLLHAPQKGARGILLTLPGNQLSLSVDDGRAYASLPDGTVTALRMSDGSLLWYHRGGYAGIAAKAIAYGTVYVALLTETGGAFQLIVNALRPDNGTLLWTRAFPSGFTLSIQLTVLNDIVYINMGDDGVAALQDSDGTLLWHYMSSIPFNLLPYVAGGVVYMGTQDAHIYALRASDGFLLWKYTTPVPPSSALPVIANGYIYIHLEDGSIDALRMSDGSLLWHYTQPLFISEFTPGIEGGALYVIALDGAVCALRASDGSLLWHDALHGSTDLSVADKMIYITTQDGSVAALQASNGSLLWQYHDGNGNAASTTVANGVAYIVSQVNDTNSIAALNASNGTLLWHYTLPVPVPSTQLSPIVTDGVVLLALQDGSVDAFQARSGALLWKTSTQ